MNKLQLIKLLEIRGITELEPKQSIDTAIKLSGGEPTDKEMVKVNWLVAEYYIQKGKEKNEEIKSLRSTRTVLENHIYDLNIQIANLQDNLIREIGGYVEDDW